MVATEEVCLILKYECVRLSSIVTCQLAALLLALPHLLHRKIVLHGTVLEASSRGRLKAHVAVGVLNPKLRCLENTRKGRRRDGCGPHKYVRGREVIEKAGRVRAILRRNCNVEDSTGAVKGFLEGELR